MAATMNARRDKHSTISFTLPISCQICLGKVKQPVLCPNNHVFCSTCMDVWLQRIQQCPACRTPVNSSNPIKHIKGGLNQVEDTNLKMTSPDMRRARFELLYKEYEDEFDHLESEMKLLKTENEILKDQLKKGGERSGVIEKPEFIHPGSSDTRSLLTLTKKLQDAQKLYEHLKNDMAKVNEENNKLKDEKVNLNRENEKLRMEIATRSPHRYGRYTVATLEAKLESYEKEIRQLNKALERSDRYVEDLESELNKLKGTIPGKANSVPPKSSLGSRNVDTVSQNPAKRQLFGSSMEDLRNLHAGDLIWDRNKQMPTSTDYQKVTSDRALGGSAKSRPRKEMQKRDDTEVTMDISCNSGSPIKDKSPKKVHFSLPKNSHDMSSFDLDQPSPLTPSSALGKMAIGNGRSSPSEIESRYFQQARHGSETTARKNSVDGNVSLDSFDGLGKKGKSILKTKERHDDSSSTSVLSVPDFEVTPTKRLKHKHDLELSDLDDTQTIRSELDDLNISLTPELSDCMKLLNRAEKKTHNTEGYVQDTGGTRTDIALDNYSSQQSQLLSPTLTTATVHPYRSNPDSLFSLQEQEYYSKFRPNPNMQTAPHNSGSSYSTLAFSDAGITRSNLYPKVVTSLPGSSFPTTGLSNSYTLPTTTSVSHSYGVSALVNASQLKGIHSMQNMDEKLHMLDITGDKYRASGLSDQNGLAAKPDPAPESSYDQYFPSATVPPQSFHSSLPINTTVKPSHRGLILKTDLPPRYPIQRRSSLDYCREVQFDPVKGSDAQNLHASQINGRKYSSLTNIPAAIPLSSSALSNYSQTVGNHLHKLNKLFPVSSSSSKGTYVSSGLPYSMSSNPSFSLSLTGSTQASSHVAHPVSRPTQALPANSMLSAAIVTNPSVVSYPASSSITFASTALRTSSSKLLAEDGLEYLTGASDVGKTGNYSYVSNASNELSSRGSDSYLPEPKKRLFESGDDLDVTLSPIKSTRIN
ncbi:uncharacterized protein [Haliotis cracherodii]|uniref:uncharacterized protein n=1 Tax=Haliotis cracherodii TaxID=6455 RepID=UPI0039E92484